MTQTGHPEELLAEYVDGTLDERDRRDVDAHLAVCATCREEAGLAGGARHGLQALPEEPVPLGVTRPVMDAAFGGRRRERAPWGQRIQWIAGVAAAAALVAVVAISRPEVGQDAATGAGGAPESLAAGDAATSTPQVAERFTAPVTLEESDRDFGDRSLRGLAMEVADAVRDGVLEPPADEGTPEEARAARECVSMWADVAEDEVLVRLIRARYQGEPAYIAVYLTGPGVCAPPSRASVWVVSADGACEFRDITEIRI